METLSQTLNGFFAAPAPKRRAQPKRPIIAILSTGEEVEIERSKNCGRSVYSYGMQSSNTLGDLLSGMDAKQKR